MDWNFDGKHDYKDDAIYNNVISNDNENKSGHPIHTNQTNNNYKCNSTNETKGGSGKVLFWILVVVVLFFIGKCA